MTTDMSYVINHIYEIPFTRITLNPGYEIIWDGVSKTWDILCGNAYVTGMSDKDFTVLCNKGVISKKPLPKPVSVPSPIPSPTLLRRHAQTFFKWAHKYAVEVNNLPDTWIVFIDDNFDNHIKVNGITNLYHAWRNAILPESNEE